jgi:antitoxin ParD1/3/4
MPLRNVTITDNEDKFIQSVIEAGQFGDADEVFRAGLNLLEKEMQENIIDQETKQKIEKGIEDIEEGRYTPVETSEDLDKFFADLRAERQVWINGKNE